ncbi:response regulator transcription factor [Acidocella sp.]|uniref:response regulator transcription factor n=1 Tax=Acidocella sp. TaxID=50710 RepID=UPI0026333962|nr:response regulator transcription factor [Acidocella sp.]
MRVLLIEDDPMAAANLCAGLAQEGHEIEIADNGRTGLLAAAAENFNVLIIDRMLPDLDGLGVLRTLRGAGIHTPALFLTALGSLDDRLEGLRSGGDDYMIKPYAIAELAARLVALARRARTPAQQVRLRVGDLELERTTRRVWRAGQKIELRPREYEVLEYLFRHPGEVVTKTMLLEDVWGFHFTPQASLVEAQISRLRAKINQGFSTPLIHTCRGAGYKLDVA